ncbi:class I SAM-dependent methyltransferase [Methylobacterium gossipiicola]|uniref:16S rRNA (Guanine1207-N2)-methyltransferase n=1 Tax=Methylobacterium gossipiicola TaxID=582675 RepID=A0A1I2SL58_9HYPH|nr:methyltransferase [Methylobacterium gossipiicola]SFG53422.1 16S rRNA (guanine1207-N2)-methyltransferase [Methylobacterium gossipiicola]
MSTASFHHAVYGLPPAELTESSDGAVQVSPLIPGSARLEDVASASLERIDVLAPAGTIERRYVLAQALRALRPGGHLTALAPKDRGGSRLAKELTGFGAPVAESARRHHRICLVERPETLQDLDAALEEGGPRHIDNLALCSQAGIFSYDRLDPGSALLLSLLPPLAGSGADFGCGLGVLARSVLHSPKVTALTLIDIDRRAVEMARRNVDDPRATLRWADIRAGNLGLSRLDFVVMNPPFHDGGFEDQALGQGFIARAAEALRPGGTLWLTANMHLPYEKPLNAAFKTVEVKAASGGYKVFEARK